MKRALSRARSGADHAGRGRACALVLAAVALASHARADGAQGDLLPPWSDADDVPLPTWAQSVAPRGAEVTLYAAPGKLDARRGVATPGARLPLFGAKRAGGCKGRWLEVGPLAWVCSDAAELSGEPLFFPSLTSAPASDGMPYRYYFAGKDGANAFLSLDTALDDAPDYELEPGWGTPIVEERAAHGERWGKTRRGRWIALDELVAARPSAFHGEPLDGALDLAWVMVDRASVYASAKADKPTGSRARLEVVHVREESGEGAAAMARIGDAEWIHARELARPTGAPPPSELDAPDERWIDVDLATQTLVAYEGPRPVFATLVSTGIGPRGSDTATPPGVHRIWVKLFATNMDNLERDDADRHYSIEDVPWVMFFDKAVALHAAFWHRDFGHPRSHGCVNLAPLDARRLFAWTAPHLPAGWSAVLPTRLERGTLVRVR